MCVYIAARLQRQVGSLFVGPGLYHTSSCILAWPNHTESTTERALLFFGQILEEMKFTRVRTNPIVCEPELERVSE